MLLSGAARRDAFGAPRAIGQVIESMFLDLACCRLAGVGERPSRPARLTAPLVVRVRLGAFLRNRWRDGRLRTVAEQVALVLVFCLHLALVSSSRFTALPTSRQQWMVVLGAYRATRIYRPCLAKPSWRGFLTFSLPI